MSTDDARNLADAEVRRGLLTFIASALGFIVFFDLVLFVWLLGGQFFSAGNFKLMAWVGALMLCLSLIQLLFLARDGRRIASLLGGVPAARYGEGSDTRKQQVEAMEAMLDELCARAGCEHPPLYVQPRNHDLNAFACGLARAGWCITVTAGAMDRLDEREMKALLGHEIAHLACGDTRTSTLICAYVAGLASLATLGLVMAAAGRGSRGSLPFLFLGLVVLLAGAIGVAVSQLLEAALSRRQEYRADAESVRLTGDPAGMVSLLATLFEDLYVKGRKPADADWNALRLRPMHFSRGGHAFWFDSHPPLLNRIRAFDTARAEELGQRLQDAKRLD